MNAYEFDYEILKSFGRVERVVKKRPLKTIRYINKVCAFDIETTNLKEFEGKKFEHAFMYLWAVQVGTENETIYGRSWEEFIYFIDNVVKVLNDDERLIIYVFNLSYEFSFLKAFYHFKPEEVFATESRRILRCTMYDKIEFRCAYFLSNLKLEKFTEEMNVEHKKLSGEKFNYDKVRYPWSDLTDYELAYMTNDVLGLVEAVEKKMKIENDDLTTIPLTSTGYVRRDLKEALADFAKEKCRFIYPSLEVYRLLRDAFRGGNTMSNRNKTAYIINNVSSYDMVSSYPNVMMVHKYPLSTFTEVSENKENFIKSTKNAYLGVFEFTNIRLRDPNYGAPYISTSKVRKLDRDNTDFNKFWNGRILRASFIETTLTDVDFRIIEKMYIWEKMEITKLYRSYYSELPAEFKAVIMKYYKDKTILKGCEKYDKNLIPFYNSHKSKLQACYGCTVEDPLKNSALFVQNEDGSERTFIEVKPEEPAKELNKARFTDFLPYQIGVWAAAWGRYELQQGIDAVGAGIDGDFVYCDTDSIKYEGEHAKDFEKLNKRAQYLATEAGAFANDKWGQVHFMGVWEDENYKLPNRFSTLGAKKYVYQAEGEMPKITISGVDKKKGGEELAEIENFKEGMIFEKAGKAVVKFNDNVDLEIEVEGHKLKISDNCYLGPGTYTVSMTASNAEILRMIGRGTLLKYADTEIKNIYEHA